MKFKIVISVLYALLALSAILAGLIVSVPEVMEKTGLNVGMGEADPLAGGFIILLGVFIFKFALYIYHSR